MIRNLPRDILNYMVDNIPPFAGVFIILADDTGNVLKWYGTYDKYIENPPDSGSSLFELFPFFEGMIPLPQKELQLPNMQLASDKYIDVHMLRKSKNETWIFCMDRTGDVESIREIIQEMNEAKLHKETGHKKSMNKFCFPNPFGQTELFGTTVFERLNESDFQLLSKTPQWLNEIKPQLRSGSKTFSPAELFPFLEVFFQEANEHWKSGSEKIFHSGTWIEQTPGGEELFLKAGAISHQGINYLLIRLLNDDLNEEQGVIQKAREQQLLYEKLTKTKNHLKQLLDYKERFVSIISHDLRSPVASVLGITEMLSNDEEFLTKLDDFNREMIQGIHDEMVRLLDYNDKLYHWSNLELGNFEIVLSKQQLSELAEKALNTSRAKMEEKNISFYNNVSGNIFVMVDRTLFLQALNNLLSNAVKFTPKGGIIKIDANTNPGQHTVNFTISDSGVGMPGNVKENLFDDSLRSSTIGTYGEKGSGLGIGIVKKVIDAHKFHIRVESEPEQGTTFIITLPFV